MEVDRDDPGPQINNRYRRDLESGATRGRNNTPGPSNVPRKEQHIVQRGPRLFLSAARAQDMPDQELQLRERRIQRQNNRVNNNNRYVGVQYPVETRPRQNANSRIDKQKSKHIGFRILETIAISESTETLSKLIESKTAFMEFIENPIKRLDIFVLIMEIMAKVSESSFDETKSKILLDVCHSNIIVSLKSYLMDLPFTQNSSKSSNSLYWNDQQKFWDNFVKFGGSIVNTSPTLALNKCRSLLEATPAACLDGLRDRHGFTLNENCSSKLAELKERMALFEKHHVVDTKSESNLRMEKGGPPENFRELSIMPSREDLLDTRPYVRPNIVSGAYQDVEHYLDVQFRLLREDCFGPLRDGLRQYLQPKSKNRYDNIRVFHDVKFVKPYFSQTNFGSLVQIDVSKHKMFKRTDWSHNKRFIFGSLVLFTKDNCDSFIVATILDREQELLSRGMIPVSVIGQDLDEQIYNDDSYTMIESEVYFEPYYHVLEVLQNPTFPRHLAMKQYIVDVDPQPHPPSYLSQETEFSTKINRTRKINDTSDVTVTIEGISETDDDNEIHKVNFTVLQEQTWPNKDELCFDGSQYDAYKLAHTHEFAVVQGPPGTGKTYLGVKVAKTLFENLHMKNDGCLMLVICYTNHALDQFLEALLDVSDSIVRIGGQSRSKAMECINLIQLRRRLNIDRKSHLAFIDEKRALKTSLTKFRNSLTKLDVLLNGVLKSKYIIDDVVEMRMLCNQLNRTNLPSGLDPLYYWLFEFHNDYHTDLGELFEQLPAKIESANAEKESRKRKGVILDELENDDENILSYRRQLALFHTEDITLEINNLVTQYSKQGPEKIPQNVMQELARLNSLKQMYNVMSAQRERRIKVKITDRTDFTKFSPRDRWSLYFRWIHELVGKAKEEVGLLQSEAAQAKKLYDESRLILDMKIVKTTKIVGMTTSGAARMRKLLQALKPPIVIVEEAAEVLEQHIITSLTDGCKHLILIGDHQQLRPSAAHVKLARHFGLEVSLFERMISNGIHSRRLSVQHRMRPEIAALICPLIYKDLENHPSVYDFPDVKGMTKNLFFFTHDFKEEVSQDGTIRTNQQEADMTLGLANYLMQQNYEPEDITILATYKGQMFYMRKESIRYTHLKGVNITVVDNYQGEESKIILLSLVRNNEENKIGFLCNVNRICVALSRAKHGFYMFGNIDTLKTNSELWSNIAVVLEKNDSIGTSLKLQCQNHNDNVTIISKLEDFQKVPEGGCLLWCDSALPKCGHKCQLLCHGYDCEHLTDATRCIRECERILCELNHVCPKKCADECGPCKRKLPKELPCGHSMDVWCYLEPDDPAVKCLTTVEVTLPDCKHEANKLCSEKVKDVRCGVRCVFRIEKCGHSCLKSCHVNEDPNHEKYICKKKCAKPKQGCTAELLGDRGVHQCPNKCCEDCEPCEVQIVKRRTTCKHLVRTNCNINPDTVTCMKKCARMLPCEHFCTKLCKEKCGDCKVMVTKVIPDCGHEVKMPCMKEPTSGDCIKQCERVMRCGHKCRDLCGRTCDPLKCAEPSQERRAAACGHSVTLPCHLATRPAGSVTPEMLAECCTTPCHAVLKCKHLCAGTCAGCRRGRLHQQCTQPCNQLNICGHQCEERCNQICPPCNKKCEVKCEHSQCRKICGMTCTSCKENCGRKCPHGSCKNYCGQVCSIAACTKPCDKLQECGHPCRGLCGDPCPPVCKICKPDTFPVDFLGDEFEDTDRFVLLEECGHIMEIENMNNLMMGHTESIGIRCCPLCRRPIVNTRRYKELVIATFRNDINPVKRRIFGTPDVVAAARNKIKQDVKEFPIKYRSVLQANSDIKRKITNIMSNVEYQKFVSKLQLDMESICLNILDMISECYGAYLESNTLQLKDEVDAQTKLLCDVFVFKKHGIFKVSEQQQCDVQLEIKRLNSIVQLAKILSHGASNPTVQAALTAAKAAVFKPTCFDEEAALAALRELEKEVKLKGIVTKQERDLIVKAIGLKAGHWYKCPKGHYYCIGECGGANQVSRCPECGSAIGGRNHTLLPGNAHAGEMDGSSYSAWSQEYNNMANFRLNL